MTTFSYKICRYVTNIFPNCKIFNNSFEHLIRSTFHGGNFHHKLSLVKTKGKPFETDK